MGDPGVYGDYAAAGIDVEVPLFAGGLLSARQKEATSRASAEQKSLEQEENQVIDRSGPTGLSDRYFAVPNSRKGFPRSSAGRSTIKKVNRFMQQKRFWPLDKSIGM
jgi:hypothetical protein